MSLAYKSIAALAVIATACSTASAAITFNIIRQTNSVDNSLDTVVLLATNDGLGDQAGGTGLSGLDITITSPSLHTGIYHTTTLSGTKYYGDPVGAHLPTSFDDYSWVGGATLAVASESPDATNANAGYATAADVPYGGTKLTSFEVAGIYSPPLPADASQNGGLGAIVALAVVNHNEPATFTGFVGGDFGSQVAIPSSPIPEPASMGLLALGAVALLRRRR